MGFNDSYPQSGNAYTANVRANFTAIKNVLSQAALDSGWIRAEVVTSDPTAGNKGRIIFNETEGIFKVDNGSSWDPLGGITKTGSYVGNGNDNRSITGVGFQPDFVMVMGDVAAGAPAATSEMGSNKSKRLSGQQVLASNLIQNASEADGFQIGSADEVNSNGLDYYYIAIREG
jgi:hypothetical protein